MKEREYRVTIHSISRIIAILISSFYLAQLIGKARVKIQFTEEGFIHIWERRFIFS